MFNFKTPWIEVCQAPLSMGFSRQEYWNGLPCPPPEDLPDQGLNPCLLYYMQIVYHWATWEAHVYPFIITFLLCWSYLYSVGNITTYIYIFVQAVCTFILSNTFSHEFPYTHTQFRHNHSHTQTTYVHRPTHAHNIYQWRTHTYKSNEMLHTSIHMTINQVYIFNAILVLYHLQTSTKA